MLPVRAIAAAATVVALVGSGCGNAKKDTPTGASNPHATASDQTIQPAATAAEIAAFAHAKVPKPSVSPIPPNRPGIKDSYDGDDNATRQTEENDDEEVEHYVHRANAYEWHEAKAFVKAYYAAALKEDGAAGCALLVPSLAEKLPNAYASSPTLSYLQGKTCPEVMTKLFTHRHKLIEAEARGVEVTDVRSADVKTAFILLAFKGIRERRFMGVERIGSPNGPMKLEAPQDSPYP